VTESVTSVSASNNGLSPWDHGFVFEIWHINPSFIHSFQIPLVQTKTEKNEIQNEFSVVYSVRVLGASRDRPDRLLHAILPPGQATIAAANLDLSTSSLSSSSHP